MRRHVNEKPPPWPERIRFLLGGRIGSKVLINLARIFPRAVQISRTTAAFLEDRLISSLADKIKILRALSDCRPCRPNEKKPATHTRRVTSWCDSPAAPFARQGATRGKHLLQTCCTERVNLQPEGGLRTEFFGPPENCTLIQTTDDENNLESCINRGFSTYYLRSDPDNFANRTKIRRLILFR